MRKALTPGLPVWISIKNRRQILRTLDLIWVHFLTKRRNWFVFEIGKGGKDDQHCFQKLGGCWEVLCEGVDGCTAATGEN